MYIPGLPGPFIAEKNRDRVETQSRCKIQYPMKNRDEDGNNISKRCTTNDLFLN